jgi:ElaB/YqjD/DUF883 family membrane-anchored ribosome-binding protein
MSVIALGESCSKHHGTPQKKENEMDDYGKQPSDSSYGAPAETVGAGTAARMKEQISATAADAKDKVTEFGRQAADRINDSRESAAGALDKTASSLHSGGDNLSSLAHSTADKLQATADYVRRTDLKGMADDVQDIVKRYPAQSLAAAVILGFLVARGLRGRD